MSLFGGTLGKGNDSSSSAAPTKSLFGTAAPTSGTGLFGNTPASTTAGGTGLFGGLGASSAQTGASQTATTGGLGGLFGAKTTAPASTSAPAFSFANTSTAQQSTTNPLQQTTAGTQPSLFAGGAATQQQQQQQQQAGAPLSQSGAPTKNAHFDNLLERGRKRNAGEDGLSSFEELPSLQLGLGDIARKVRNLGAGGPSADQTQDRTA
jgi:nuclear pore complex protein Nup93